MSLSIEPENDLIPSYLNELINKKHGFKKDVKIKQMLDFINKDINKNPKRTKSDINIVLRVCNLVENIVDKKDKIDKLDIVIEAFKLIFASMTPQEIESLKNTVQFLLDSNLVKKINSRKRVYNYCSKVIQSNLFF